jgi:ribonucleoside-diphosphate reductase alpha chain
LTVEARVGGEKIFVRTGEFDDGSLGEVFIDFSEGDSTLKGSCQAFAKLLSLSLQHGMALDELCKHFLGIEFAPFGVIVGHPNIKMSNSIIDFVFRVLSFHYMKNQSFVHIKETSGYSDVQILTTSDNPKCPQCGNKTIRNGTCYKCENCGSTTGCS